MKTRKNFRVVFLSLPAMGGVSAVCGVTNRYVWADSPSPGSGFLTWDTAAHSIQDAVDAVDAEHADTVLVTNGV